MSNPRELIPQIVQTVGRVLGDAPRPIPLHVPTFDGREWDYVKQCIDTGWVSSVGAFVNQFEEQLAQATGARHAVAVCTGTAALHVALLMAGVQPGDEVLCPALTFVATANAVSYCGAVPHFVDVEALTMGVDPQALRDYAQSHLDRRDDGQLVNKQTGRRIAALIAMHAFGHPADLDGLVSLCDDLGIELVEDAAESLGSTYKDRHTGTFGRLGILSFNGNKIVTTGGGGAILTNDAELASKAKHLTSTGKVGHRFAYEHDIVAYNYRMPNLNAALGCGQLEHLDDMIQRKRVLAQRYTQAFEHSGFGSILQEPANTRSNYWFSSLVMEPHAAAATLPAIEALHDAGVLARPIWKPMHELPMYAHCPRMPLPVTEDLAGRVISLPSSAGL